MVLADHGSHCLALGMECKVSGVGLEGGGGGGDGGGRGWW